MTVPQAFELGRLWYGDRLDEHWQPKSPARARELFAAVGLTGPFWTSGEFA